MLRLKTGLKIWSDSGTLGLDQASHRLNSLFGRELQNIGLAEHQDFETPTFWGTGHSESFWARRVELPINFWLADTAGAT
jgi:hypothetical protein